MAAAGSGGKKRKLKDDDIEVNPPPNITDNDTTQRLYQQVDKDLVSAMTAVEKARSSLWQLQNHVGDQLSWLAYQKVLDVNIDIKFINATDLVNESRCRVNETGLLDVLHLDLVILNMFKFLPLLEILKLRLISKRMFKEVTRLWAKCRVWNIKMYSNYNNFNPPQHFYEADTDLNIKFDYFRWDVSIIKQIMKRCAGRIVSIVDLKSECLDEIPEYVCNKIKRLKTLDVRGGHSKNTFTLLNQSAEILERLYVSDLSSDGAMVHKNLPNLKHLNIGCSKNDELLLSLLKKSRSSLEYLYLGEESEVNCLADLNNDCKLNIKYISLGPTMRMNWSAFAAMVNNSPDISELDLYTTKFFSLTENLENIKLDKLKHLNININLYDKELEFEDLEYFVYILEACKNNLEYLELNLLGDWANDFFDFEFFLPKVKKVKVTHEYGLHISYIQDHFSPGTEIEKIKDD